MASEKGVCKVGGSDPVPKIYDRVRRGHSCLSLPCLCLVVTSLSSRNSKPRHQQRQLWTFCGHWTPPRKDREWCVEKGKLGEPIFLTYESGEITSKDYLHSGTIHVVKTAVGPGREEAIYLKSWHCTPAQAIIIMTKGHSEHLSPPFPHSGKQKGFS